MKTEFLPKRMREESIYNALRTYGPMTSEEIGRHIDLSRSCTHSHITRMRSEGKPIYIHGRHTDTVKAKPKIVYAYGTEKDRQFAISRPPSKDKRLVYPGMTEDEIMEMREEQRRNARAALCKPFRDEMLFLTAGRAA